VRPGKKGNYQLGKRQKDAVFVRAKRGEAVVSFREKKSDLDGRKNERMCC